MNDNFAILSPQRQKELYVYALKCLGQRDYAAQELSRKLASKKSATPTEMTEIIERLEAEHWLNDERCAQNYIKQGMTRGYGPAKIRYELQQRGVATELIEQTLNQPAEVWLALARQVREKKFGHLLPSEHKEKVHQMRFLQYRGFSASQINRVIHHDDEC